ncbi:hypothetical protein LVJ94_24210 [Pendulispora rubella]|uniref:Uncharacterized protein n=1 Tax=Pendulispora rubella TaxID=2741070 RepID=A0ABZ2LMD9_9BACT
MPKRLLLTVAAWAAVCAVGLTLVIRACSSPGRAESAADAGVPEGGAAVRCTRESNAVALGEGFARGDALVGEAVATNDGYAIGLVRPVGKERHAGMAVVKGDLSGGPTFIDLGQATGDLPPPRPFVQRGELFAAAYARGTDSRNLVLSRVQGTAAAVFAEMAQERDESLAFDVVTSPAGRGIVAWDEDAASGDAGVERGVIKVALIPQSAEKNIAGAIVSASGADVERPHGIARAGGGYWLGWIARRRDPRGENDPKGLEGPGEDRAYAWVEVARLDDAGKRVGEVRRVTSDAGHVTAFDWLAAADGNVELFVRDDGETTQEGEGGRILRIGVRDDGLQPSQALVSGGVGQGDPAPLGDPGNRWLFYTDVTEHAQALFLDGSPALATPMAMPALDGQSPLSSKSSGPVVLLLAVGASAEGKDQAEARLVRCEALNR